MFERFTDRARRVVVLAQEEARMLNHNYIGTEHILLGLIHEGEGVAAKALESLGISLDAVRGQVEEIIGQGQAAPTGHFPFTPRAKKVLELSLREAKQLYSRHIGTEHILLGLIREGEGVAAQVLQKLGADLNQISQQVMLVLKGYGVPATLAERLAQFHSLPQEDVEEAQRILQLPEEATHALSELIVFAKRFGLNIIDLAQYVREHRLHEPPQAPPYKPPHRRA
jgi:ATP-dependent Clp protease ATP-binding subunit ClpA